MGVYQIGEVIKRTRESLGITQMDLCDGICSVETLSKIENGKRKPNRANFQALMERLGKSGERYLPFVHSEEVSVIKEVMNVSTLISRYRYQELDNILNNIERKLDLTDNINRQFILKTRAVTDYFLKRIDIATKRKQLIEAFLCTVKGYKNGELPKGIYSRHEIIIFCNIASSYAQEGNYDTAIRMLRQVEHYFNTTNINIEERAISETLLLSNLGQTLGIKGDTKEAIKITKRAIEICLKEGVSNILDSLLYNFAFGKEILREDVKACKELLLQAYFIAELNDAKYMLNHIKNHIRKKYYNEVERNHL